MTGAERQRRFYARRKAAAEGEKIGFSEREIGTAARSIGLGAALIKALIAALRESRR